jgi:hypothetical protein
LLLPFSSAFINRPPLSISSCSPSFILLLFSLLASHVLASSKIVSSPAGSFCP